MGPLAANWMRSSGRQWHETETALARAKDSLSRERCQLPVGFAHQLQANKNKWGAYLLGTPPTVFAALNARSAIWLSRRC